MKDRSEEICSKQGTPRTVLVRVPVLGSGWSSPGKPEDVDVIAEALDEVPVGLKEKIHPRNRKPDKFRMVLLSSFPNQILELLEHQS